MNVVELNSDNEVSHEGANHLQLRLQANKCHDSCIVQLSAASAKNAKHVLISVISILPYRSSDIEVDDKCSICRKSYRI
jgi:hypothetical protein